MVAASVLPKTAASALRRAAAIAGFIVLIVPAAAARAQDANLAGSWSGMAQGMTVNLVVGPDMAFSEQQVMGQMMTSQTGHIVPMGQGVVTFMVEDWEPKTMPVYHPTGTVGGYYTQQPTAKPPGGTWRYQFGGPGVLTLQDANLGGTITLQRVR